MRSAIRHLACAVLLSSTASSAEAAPAADDAGRPLAGGHAEEEDTKRRWWLRPTVKLSCPLIATLGCEVVVDASRSDLFPVATVDVGVAGASAAVGVGWGGMGGFGYHALKAVAIRTWGEPLWADEDVVLAGVVYQLSPVFYEFSLGPVIEVDDDAEVIVAATLGLQF